MTKQGEIKVCEECGKHEAMHFGDRDLCCWCHVKSGGIPADWHMVCMEVYRSLQLSH